MSRDQISQVVVVHTEDRQSGVVRSIRALGVNPVKNKDVLIKPNFNTADVVPGSTHNDTLVALVDADPNGLPRYDAVAVRLVRSEEWVYAGEMQWLELGFPGEGAGAGDPLEDAHQAGLDRAHGVADSARRSGIEFQPAFSSASGACRIRPGG